MNDKLKALAELLNARKLIEEHLEIIKKELEEDMSKSKVDQVKGEGVMAYYQNWKRVALAPQKEIEEFGLQGELDKAMALGLVKESSGKSLVTRLSK